MYKAQKTIYGAIKGEITPGRPAIIHRNDQVPGLDWQISPVVRIISMAIMGGRLGVNRDLQHGVYRGAGLVLSRKKEPRKGLSYN